MGVNNMANEYYKEIAIKAANALGLRLSGVDMIIKDIEKPNSEYVILEINSAPGFGIHINPDFGKSINPMPEILKAFVYNSDDGK